MLTRRLENWLGQLGWGLLAGALGAAACGTKDEGPPVTGTGLDGGGNRMNIAGRGGKGSGGGAGEGAGEGGMGDVSATGGTSGSSGTGGTGGTGGVNLLGAPIVHVTSPAAVTDPNDRAVIVGDEIDVLCTATKSTDKGAKSVDQATVLLELLDGDGLVVETHPGTPTDNADEYTAHFITRKVSTNGGMSVECQASDTSSPAIMGTDRIDTFVDHGPSSLPVAPPVGDADNPPFATAVGQALHVAFKVAQAPVAKGDDGAAIGDVSLTVGGKSFDLTKTNGQYTATVHLDDPKIFRPTPDGDQKIVITAGDQRSPSAAVNQIAYDFIVDGTGPDITIVSPHAGDVRSGKVQFVIKITDGGSGVDPLSVVATINNTDYAYSDSDPSWSYDQASGTFTFYFDTTQIENSVAQATLQVVASDKVANTAKASVLLQLDNVPPIVELDPLPVREYKHTAGNCSLAFDPVGPAAASDLQVVYDFQVFRALVWEETNHARGQSSGLAAGADLGSVVLYLQPNVEQGLLKDTNGDHYCDALETKDADTGKDLHSISLKAISPQGSSWFGPASAEDATLNAEFGMPAGCNYENAMTPPTPLCPPTNSSDMSRVISWDIDHTVPAIFGVEPLSGLSCTGYGWEINSVVSEGWLCAAATAMDNNGNVGISVPIRLCYDDGKGPAPDCANSNSNPPSCVEDGCILPPRLGSGLLEP
ncbi:MAG TPA: hypothetical protein VLJ38_02535, partial [Polyangiaceae bacterium]|nr:hypothetical protein [Polyangiaceae bacterium]